MLGFLAFLKTTFGRILAFLVAGAALLTAAYFKGRAAGKGAQVAADAVASQKSQADVQQSVSDAVRKVDETLAKRPPPDAGKRNDFDTDL